AFALCERFDDALEIRRANGHALCAAGVETSEQFFRDFGGGGRRLDLEPAFAGDEFDAEQLLRARQVFLMAGVKLIEVPRIGEMQGFGNHVQAERVLATSDNRVHMASSDWGRVRVLPM